MNSQLLDDEADVVVYESAPPPMIQQPRPADSMSSQIQVIAHLSEVAARRPRNEAISLRKIINAADETSVWKVPQRGEGLSVKLARMALQYYGNAACLPTITECPVDTPSGMVPGWRIQALTIDMENMVIQMTSASTPKPTRKGDEKDLAYEQRCFQQQLAFAGRVERNAIMKIIPGGWHKQIKDAVTAKAQAKPLKDRIAVMVNTAKARGISESQLRTLHGINPNSYSEAQWADVQGRLAAIAQNEMTIEQAFAELFEAGNGDAAAPPPQGRTKVGQPPGPAPDSPQAPTSDQQTAEPAHDQHQARTILVRPFKQGAKLQLALEAEGFEKREDGSFTADWTQSREGYALAMADDKTAEVLIPKTL